jgi:hypothetical protein
VGQLSAEVEPYCANRVRQQRIQPVAERAVIRRRLARAVLESMDEIKLDAVVYPSWNNPPH